VFFATMYVCVIFTLTSLSLSASDDIEGSLFSKLDIGHRPGTTALPRIVDAHEVAFRHTDILEEYRNARDECLDRLNTLSATGKFSPSNATDDIDAARLKFYFDFGILLWGFAPSMNCSIHSKCWFGVISCGNFKGDTLHEQYVKANIQYSTQSERVNTIKSSTFDPNQFVKVLPLQLNFTLRALHIIVRIVGREILAPETLLFVVPNSVHGGVGEEIIIAEYSLTIPGDYVIEYMLSSFFPGIMYNYTIHEIQQGLDTLHAETYFDRKSIRSFPIKVTLSGGSRSHEAHMTSQLPYCPNGNHPGRWIVFPEEVARQCGAGSYISSISRLPYLATNYDKIERITRQYTMHALTLKYETVMGSVLKGLKNSSLPDDVRIYYKELVRYAHGNVCLLMYLGINHPYYDNRLELFAPYECRYRIMTPGEGRKCLRDKERTDILFHGDSISRDLFQKVSEQLDLAHVSPEELKRIDHEHLFSTVHNKERLVFSKEGVSCALDSSWNPLDSKWNLGGRLPKVYFDDFSIAHIKDYDMEVLHDKLMTSEWFRVWYDGHNKSTTASVKVRIFMGAKVVWNVYPVHKRNPEVFRRMNALLREFYVNQFNFLEQDEYLYTAAKYDFHDGWHYQGVSRIMSSVIAINLMCS